jgi:hypothetical protein
MRHRKLLIGLAAAAALLAPPAQATTLIQMNLKDLATRADRIFRGTVVGVNTGTVRAGGSDLPTITYRLKVAETFKGEYAVVKDDAALVEIQMIGPKEDRSANGQRHFSIFRDVPRLAMGGDYVLFTTRPSAAGLSTTVGLGQGAFSITGAGKEEAAVNSFGNAGLKSGLSPAGAAASRLPSGGPVPYPQLAAAIRAVLSE